MQGKDEQHLTRLSGQARLVLNDMQSVTSGIMGQRRYEARCYLGADFSICCQGPFPLQVFA
jgi:hypothetical protein